MRRDGSIGVRVEVSAKEVVGAYEGEAEWAVCRVLHGKKVRFAKISRSAYILGLPLWPFPA